MAERLKARVGSTSAHTANDCLSCEFRTLRMFCNLGPEALADFEKIGTKASFPRGATLFREDSPSSGVIVLCTGQVKLSCTSKDGKTLILKIAMPGDVLGLSAVISNTPHEVTAETLETTQLKSIRRADMLEFLHKHGQASLHAAKALSMEYKSAFYDARRLALSGTVAGRLASTFLEWGQASSCGKTEMRFTMALTHEDLASLVSTSRETVTRVLGRFQKDKLIEIRGSSLRILSPEGLEALTA
jgi:CRP/FNR family transcriptional regulator, cyclic AMP receptor protein